MNKKVIYGINGPVVTVKETEGFSMQEMVYVGNERLVGEVIGIKDDTTTIQVYEVTTGLKPGEPVVTSGSPLALVLGPGILRNIFDGIERPLPEIEEKFGPFIQRGNATAPLNTEKEWDVTVTVKAGDYLEEGQDVYKRQHILTGFWRRKIPAYCVKRLVNPAGWTALLPCL